MSLYYVDIAISFLTLLGCLTLCHRIDRLMVGVLTIIVIYFCLLGPWFWIASESTYFVQIRWGEAAVLRPAAFLAVCVAALAIIITVGGRMWLPRRTAATTREGPPAVRSKNPMLGVLVLLGVGWSAALFVVAAGANGNAIGSVNMSPVFLIAYQFSDLIIPGMLLYLVKRGTTRLGVLLILLYLLYSVFLGLRYRLVVVMIPLLVYFKRAIMKSWFRMAGSALAVVLVLALFGIMTVYRSKFSGLDFSRQNESGLVYGLMAETNLLFGLNSVLEVHLDVSNFYPLQPFIDSLVDFLPRALFSDKNTGEYLQAMQINMGREGSRSGTTYPVIGEFVIMGGYIGLVIGTLLYAWLYLFLRTMIIKRAITNEAMIVGVALVAAVMGYYHLTRGFLPQATKAYVFVIVPYLLMAGSRRLSARRDFQGLGRGSAIRQAA